MDKGDAVSVLIRVMNDGVVPYDVRAGAAYGLGSISSAEVRAALAKMVKNGSAPSVVRAAAAEALGRAAS